jgi:macrolide-specific efflux system membrane fusion protein
MRNHLLTAIAILSLAGVAWWSFGRSAGPDVTGTETVEVLHRDFSSTVIAIGAVKPQVGAEVRVGSRISGRVERLYANIGDLVENGQVLAELEGAELTAVVARRQAAVAVAQAKIADAQARERLAESAYARQQSLLAGSATSQQMVDEALRERESAAAGLQIAQREYELARAELEEALVNLSYATISAPISGVVASVTTQEGETVAAGLNAPTFVVILDLERLQVNTFVDEVDIGKIDIGQRASFTVDAFPARDFTGHVTAIYPTATIQDNVVKYIVAVGIGNDEERLLRPEMTANVQVQLESRNVLAVPTRAIRQEGGRSVVYILNDGQAEPRAVRIGWRDGPWAEIVEGIAVGERVFLDAPIEQEGS